jgi:MFS family permease
MAATVAVQKEDLIPVRSRIAWPAIVGGSVLALSLYFLLALLGSAIGFSLGDKVSPHSLSVAAAVYAIVITAVCLFLGGCVASQLTTGENKMEGSLYGIFVWATVFAVLVWMTVAGVKVGFNAIVGVATAGTVTVNNTQQADWEAAARQAGVPHRATALQVV